SFVYIKPESAQGTQSDNFVKVFTHEDNMSTESLRDQHEKLGRAVTKLISEHAGRLDAAPVTSRATPDDLKELFAEPLPQAGMTADEIFDQFARDVVPHAMQVPSPHYFGQFNPTPLAIGVWADARSE